MIKFKTITSRFERKFTRTFSVSEDRPLPPPPPPSGRGVPENLDGCVGPASRNERLAQKLIPYFRPSSTHELDRA